MHAAPATQPHTAAAVGCCFLHTCSHFAIVFTREFSYNSSTINKNCRSICVVALLAASSKGELNMNDTNSCQKAQGTHVPHEDISNTEPTNEELTIAVAKAVGFRVDRHGNVASLIDPSGEIILIESSDLWTDDELFQIDLGRPGFKDAPYIPNYAEDLNAAFGLLPSDPGVKMKFIGSGIWYVSAKKSGFRGVDASLPRAICKAFLAAAGFSDEENKLRFIMLQKISDNNGITFTQLFDSLVPDFPDRHQFIPVTRDLRKNGLIEVGGGYTHGQLSITDAGRRYLEGGAE